MDNETGMNGRDLYLMNLPPRGKAAFITAHRVWDVERFINSVKAYHAVAADGKPDGIVVRVTTRETYMASIKKGN